MGSGSGAKLRQELAHMGLPESLEGEYRLESVDPWSKREVGRN